MTHIFKLIICITILLLNDNIYSSTYCSILNKTTQSKQGLSVVLFSIININRNNHSYANDY